MTLASLIPNCVLFHPQRLREFLKHWHKFLIRSYGIFAVNSTVVNLILTWVSLFEDTRHNTLTYNSLSKIVNNHCPRCEKTFNVQLVNHSNTHDILARRYSCGLVSTF